jgi:AcrR family transcriptional regulator
MQDNDKKNKKEQIYKAAAKLFREKGYNAASMRDLAGRVQLKASVCTVILVPKKRF